MIRIEAKYAALILFLFVLISISHGQPGPPIPTMDEHRCPNAAWVADGTRFRYIWKRKSDITPVKTFFNGQYPYVYAHTFQKGQTLHLRGFFDFQNGDDSFEINMLGGSPLIDPQSGADVFHIKLTFNDDQTGKDIILNTFKNGKWLAEVKTRNPFHGGFNFLFTFHAMTNKFEVRFYGNKLLEYPYRLPLDYITMVNAIGSASRLDQIYLGGQPMRTPLRIIFPEGGLNVGDVIQLDGIPGNLDFTMEFSDGKGLILQIKTNFALEDVILNSRIGKVWGEEVRALYFPFEGGKTFEMEMRFNEEYIMILVDNAVIVNWNHRAKHYGEMSIYGSLELKNFVICGIKQMPSWVGDDFVKYGGSLSAETVPYDD
uniref:Galectin n=1 Tax=Panagrellus redivivus TaxID=6233 RepID=A0A7E4VW19_PANRE